jgi:hypothetical protein
MDPGVSSASSHFADCAASVFKLLGIFTSLSECITFTKRGEGSVALFHEGVDTSRRLVSNDGYGWQIMT